MRSQSCADVLIASHGTDYEKSAIVPSMINYTNLPYSDESYKRVMLYRNYICNKMYPNKDAVSDVFVSMGAFATNNYSFLDDDDLTDSECREILDELLVDEQHAYLTLLENKEYINLTRNNVFYKDNLLNHRYKYIQNILNVVFKNTLVSSVIFKLLQQMEDKRNNNLVKSYTGYLMDSWHIFQFKKSDNIDDEAYDVLNATEPEELNDGYMYESDILDEFDPDVELDNFYGN